MKMTLKIPFLTCAFLMAGHLSLANMNDSGKKTSETDAGATSDSVSGTTSDTTSGTTSGMMDESDSVSGATTGSADKSKMKRDKAGAMGLKQGHHYQVIEFKRGTAELTEPAKSSLRSLVSNAKMAGAIDQVHVAGWSDQAFPRAEGAQLSESARDLAQRRLDAVDRFLSDQLQVSEVETYSMAEKSNWFARAFDTDEAELKSLFSQQGAPATVDPEEFRVIKSNGGPMKAVILIEMEEATGARQPASVDEGTDASGY